MSYLTIFFDQMSYLAKCRINQKSYATNCRIGEMVFDKLSCTPCRHVSASSRSFRFIFEFENVLKFYNLEARASDFFQDCWDEVTHGAKSGGSFSEMMGPSISNEPQLTFG